MKYYYRSTLYHHGILGQKWGDRNGPPYPLDQKTHNSVVKSEKKERKGLSDETKSKLKKAAIIGAAIAGTALIAYGSYKILNNSNAINKGKEKCSELLHGDNISELHVPQEPLNESAVIQRAIDGFNETDSKMFDPQQLKKLTDDEMRCLQVYTTSWYHDINHIFRNDGDPVRDRKIVEGICKNLKSAFQKVSLSSDFNVARGIDADTTANKLLNPDLYAKLMSIKQQSGDYSGTKVLDDLKGYINLDPGIMSTSYNTSGKVIESFSGKRGVIVDIFAKKGQHGIVMRPFSEAPHEFEVAFSPESAFQFTGEYKIVNGIIHLTAELIQ